MFLIAAATVHYLLQNPKIFDRRRELGCARSKLFTRTKDDFLVLIVIYIIQLAGSILRNKSGNCSKN
jgi:hypothetical protein